MFLSRKFKVQTLVFIFLKPVLPLPFSATFQDEQDDIVLVSQPGGHEITMLMSAFHAGQRQPLPAWLKAPTVPGAKGELNWFSPDSLLLPVILALWSVKPVAHHKSQEAKLVHLWSHSGLLFPLWKRNT